jgi:O-antigen/teichoic acid export membrane protein
MRSGAVIAVSRMFQACIPWIPVWILTSMGQPEQAAIYAVASRLVVALTSVVATLRFSARSEIVMLHNEGKSREIALLSRKTSIVSCIPIVVGFLFLYQFGEEPLLYLLGENYRPALPVLIVLSAGVMAEAFGGLSDEILKMIGKNKIVLLTQAAAIVIQVLLCLFLSQFGAKIVAFATVWTFTQQYTMQIFWLSTKTDIKIFHFTRRNRK